MGEAITVLGAGAVGRSLAARLARSGADVVLYARDEGVARAIAANGLGVGDPDSGARWRVAVPVTTDLGSLSPRLAAGPAIVCTRADDSLPLIRRIVAVEPRARVVTAQNGVATEAAAAEHVRDVIGLVYRQTCTLDADDTVLALGRGRIVVGLHPRGVDDATRRLAEALVGAGYDVGLSGSIADDKWLKLCVNTLSPVNALVRRADHTDPAFVHLKVALLREARGALAAADIAARSCDGRDRDLDAEIAQLQASLEDGSSVRDLPLYNAVWAALRDPRKALEADAHHRAILELARAAGTNAPTHAALLDIVVEVHRSRRGPEAFGAEELWERCRAAPRAGAPA